MKVLPSLDKNSITFENIFIIRVVIKKILHLLCIQASWKSTCHGNFQPITSRFRERVLHVPPNDIHESFSRAVRLFKVGGRALEQKQGGEEEMSGDSQKLQTPAALPGGEQIYISNLSLQLKAKIDLNCRIFVLIFNCQATHHYILTKSFNPACILG